MAGVYRSFRARVPRGPVPSGPEFSVPGSYGCRPKKLADLVSRQWVEPDAKAKARIDW